MLAFGPPCAPATSSHNHCGLSAYHSHCTRNLISIINVCSLLSHQYSRTGFSLFSGTSTLTFGVEVRAYEYQGSVRLHLPLITDTTGASRVVYYTTFDQSWHAALFDEPCTSCPRNIDFTSISSSHRTLWHPRHSPLPSAIVAAV
jgi:hypothetical protein